MMSKQWSGKVSAETLRREGASEEKRGERWERNGGHCTQKEQRTQRHRGGAWRTVKVKVEKK